MSFFIFPFPLLFIYFLPKTKVGMLDNLLDIEVAYSLLKSGEDDRAKDPLDVNYEKLKTDLEVCLGYFSIDHGKVLQ